MQLLFHLLQPLYLRIQLEKLDHLVKIAMHLNRTNEREKNKQHETDQKNKKKHSTYTRSNG